MSGNVDHRGNSLRPGPPRRGGKTRIWGTHIWVPDWVGFPLVVASIIIIAVIVLHIASHAH
jgi:hypothetical protein